MTSPGPAPRRPLLALCAFALLGAAAGWFGALYLVVRIGSRMTGFPEAWKDGIFAAGLVVGAILGLLLGRRSRSA